METYVAERRGEEATGGEETDCRLHADGCTADEVVMPSEPTMWVRCDVLGVEQRTGVGDISVVSDCIVMINCAT
jgi:hypothetical protein